MNPTQIEEMRKRIEDKVLEWRDNSDSHTLIYDSDMRNLFDLVEAFALEIRDDALEEAAKLCDAERIRQINGDRFEKLNGQDTAFALTQKLRTHVLATKESET